MFLEILWLWRYCFVISAAAPGDGVNWPDYQRQLKRAGGWHMEVY